MVHIRLGAFDLDVRLKLSPGNFRLGIFTCKFHLAAVAGYSGHWHAWMLSILECSFGHFAGGARVGTLAGKVFSGTRLFLVSLGFFMCHVYWSQDEQLSHLHTERDVLRLPEDMSIELKHIGR